MTSGIPPSQCFTIGLPPRILFTLLLILNSHNIQLWNFNPISFQVVQSCLASLNLNQMISFKSFESDGKSAHTNSNPIHFFMALPYISKRKILLTVLLPTQWRRCTVLNFTMPTASFACQQNSSSKAMEGGTATRAIVPREWDDQNATSPEHSNQRKKRSISKPVIFSTRLWPLKSSY